MFIRLKLLFRPPVSFERQSPQRRSVRKTNPNEEGETQRTRGLKPPPGVTNPEVKMMVVWLESFEDHLNFPTGKDCHGLSRIVRNCQGLQDRLNQSMFCCRLIGDLLGSTSSAQETISAAGNIRIEDRVNDCFVIFIHALKSGLYRIHLKGPQSRFLSFPRVKD